MARISQVTWLRSLLCRTATISRGSVHCCQYLAMVISSAMPFICIAPSPTNAMPGRSGCAHFAPITYGTPGPMVARVPDSEPRTPARNLRWRAYQLAAEPESAATMASVGHALGEFPEDPHRVERVGVGHRGALHGGPPAGHVLFDAVRARTGRVLRSSSGISACSVRFGVADQVDLVGVAHPDPLAGAVDLHRAGLVEVGQELGVGEVGSDGEQRVAVAHQMPAGGGAQQPDRAGHPRQVVGQHVLAQQRLGRAGAQQVGDLGELGDAAARALADQHGHLVAGVEQVGGLADRGVVGHDPRARTVRGWRAPV